MDKTTRGNQTATAQLADARILHTMQNILQITVIAKKYFQKGANMTSPNFKFFTIVSTCHLIYHIFQAWSTE